MILYNEWVVTTCSWDCRPNICYLIYLNNINVWF